MNMVQYSTGDCSELISLLQEGYKLYNRPVVAQLHTGKEMCILHNRFHYFVHLLEIISLRAVFMFPSVGAVCSFMWLKWLGSDVDHSPPYSTEVKNEWSHMSAPTVCLHG